MDDLPSGRLDVEPTRLGHRHSARLPVIVAGAAAVFVLVTVLKPWAAGDAAGRSPGLSPISSAAAPGEVTPGGDAPVRVPIAVMDQDLVAVTRPRAQWGVRAVGVPEGAFPDGDGTGAGLVERWTALAHPGPPAGSVVTIAAPAAIAEEGDAVLAIGFSTGTDVLPLDVRVWRLDAAGVPRRIVPLPVIGPDPGSWLWRPDRLEAGPSGAWPAGSYRFDMLLGRWVEQVVLVVPGSPSPVSRGEPVADLPNDLDVGPGHPTGRLFVVTGGRARGVASEALGVEAMFLGERDAWLLPGVDGALTAVGMVAADDVAGIGVRLPGALSPDLALKLLSPVEGTVAAAVLVVDHGGTTAVVAHANGGRPFTGGTYRILATWRTADGRSHVEVRFLELVPSTPPAPPGSPLAALRHLSDGAPAAAGLPLLTDADLRPSGLRGTCRDGGIDGSRTSLVGLALPPGREAVAIRLTSLGGARIDTRSMLPGDNGIALLALPRGGLGPGRHRVDVSWADPGGAGSGAGAVDRVTAYDLCAG